MEQLFFLKNNAVNAIIFMQAQLQVELTNATLTCYPGPVVLGATGDFSLAHADYKNQLCQFIGQTVAAITETEKGLILTFKEGELLFEKDGPREVLVVTDGNGEWHSYPDGEIFGVE